MQVCILGIFESNTNLTDQKWRHFAWNFSQLVQSEDDLWLEVIQKWDDQKSQKIGHGHVQQEQVGGLESQQFVLDDDDHDGEVANQADQCDQNQH